MQSPNRRYRLPSRTALVSAAVAAATLGSALTLSPGVVFAAAPSAAPCQEVSGLTPRLLASRTMLLGIDSLAPADSKAIVDKIRPGGIMVRDKPTGDLKKSLATITSGVGPLIVAVDEEGGRVQRLRNVLAVLPSARQLAATQTPEQVRATIAKHAQQMRALGFTMDLAPVADLTDATSGVISDRSFSADPAKATLYVQAYAQGLLDGGIVPVIKHFPGHGRASGDSHQLLPTTPAWAQLQGIDVVPFVKVLGGLNGRGVVMMGHLAVPGLSGDQPATIVPAAVDAARQLRPEFVMTDDLGMGAITANGRTPPLAAEAALRAGNDLILFAWEPKPAAIVDHLVSVMAKDPAFAARVGEAACRVTQSRTRQGAPATPATPATTKSAPPTTKPAPVAARTSVA